MYLYRTVIGILTGIALKDLNFNLGVSVAASPICVCAVCAHVCVCWVPVSHMAFLVVVLKLLGLQWHSVGEHGLHCPAGMWGP